MLVDVQFHNQMYEILEHSIACKIIIHYLNQVQRIANPITFHNTTIYQDVHMKLIYIISIYVQ